MAKKEDLFIPCINQELKVLYLDDSAPDRLELSQILRRWTRWKTIPVAKSADFYKCLKDEAPEIVIIDQELIGDTQQGDEVARTVFRTCRRDGAWLPVVIIFTHLPFSDFVGRGRPRGDAFIGKERILGHKLGPALLLEVVVRLYTSMGDCPDRPLIYRGDK